MLVLGVESSCDETSVAIVRDGKEVLANIVLSQIDIHTKFGGVVPEVASRNHVYQVSLVFKEAFIKSGVKPEEIDVVAVTYAPGLIGSLLVGLTAAKTFALIYNKPIVGIHHLAGHIYANGIEHNMQFPAMALVVSGGNTELVYMKDNYEFEIIGETYDDAVGESYDKVARVLGLGYPGGPAVDKLAKEGKATYKLPHPYVDGYNFSFSGLKSAVINLVHNEEQRKNEIRKADLAASFQDVVTEILVNKTIKACEAYQVKNIIVAGGVSANSGLKARFNAINDGTYNINIPSIKYCTDNAAMIGVACYYKLQKKKDFADLSLNAYANLELA